MSATTRARGANYLASSVAFEKPIYITRPLLPDLEAYKVELEDIWESGTLTNNGPKHQELERQLSTTLKARHLSLFNNGTISLIVACQAMRLSGEVITTPFTFPATSHVLSWNGIKPIFADIHPDTLTLDPAAIEPLVTAKTTGILGVHVYGMPCDVYGIQTIADYFGLKVIYDGAHSFGTEIDGVPIGNFGDATMLSFHATKLFHTVEGGALIVGNEKLKTRVDFLKNFGIKNETEVVMPGINGKMNEFQAAMGILNLKMIESEKAKRRLLGEAYRVSLEGIEGISCFTLPKDVVNSEQYFVIRIDEFILPGMRDALYFRLKEFNVHTRRYFYPLCSEANCYRSLPSSSPSNLPVAHRVAREVLALPYFGELTPEAAYQISELIRAVVHHG